MPPRAKLFGVVFDRSSGRICQVYNPDYDVQLDLAAARLSPDQFMLKLEKEKHGISRQRNAMTLEQVADLQKRFDP